MNVLAAGGPLEMERTSAERTVGANFSLDCKTGDFTLQLKRLGNCAALGPGE
jgi:hypothetical protein